MRIVSRLRLAALAVASASALLVGCGGGSDGNTPTTLVRIFVGNEGNGSVTQLDPAGNGSVFFPGGAAGPFTMTGLAFDRSSRTLYSARNGNDDSSIWQYTTGGTQTVFATQRHDGTPLNAMVLAVSPSGVLHALCLGPNVIVRFDAAGAATLVHDCGTSDQMFGLCFSPQGDLYYSDFDVNLVHRVTGLTTRETMADATDGIEEPTAVACDSTGALYVACRSQDTIWRFDAPGSGIAFAGAPEGVTDCFAMAFDHEDNLWVVNYSPASVTIIDADGLPVGTIPFADGSDGLTLPRSIALELTP